LDQSIPDDSWVKLPWQAEGILADIIESTEPEPPVETELPSLEAQDSPNAVEASVFRSDVRMVNLMASVLDERGAPLLDLEADDFEVLEDGVAQKVASVESEEAPFNLAILLDWSSSTRKDRVAMKIAAQRFVDAARPQDRVAVYALVADLFTVISPLSGDHEFVKSRVQSVPASTGASPIYDAIVLAYTQELRNLPDERNALIILSDGVDNQIREKGFSGGSTDIGRLQANGLPSKVSFEDLKQAAGQMKAVLYPVFLPPRRSMLGVTRGGFQGPGGVVSAPSMEGSGSRAGEWQLTARARLLALAEQSGGRLFQAKSIRDLKPIFPQVTDELRSVYSISYYPANQNFDGSSRKVTVQVKGKRAVVRTRESYVAR
jgi:VWFA-related protein